MDGVGWVGLADHFLSSAIRSRQPIGGPSLGCCWCLLFRLTGFGERDDDELVGAFIYHELEAAGVAAIHDAQQRAGLLVSKLNATGRTGPRHVNRTPRVEDEILVIHARVCRYGFLQNCDAKLFIRSQLR
jgi:hypothetical protein